MLFSSSTFLQQHTQTHSTRLVALTNNDLKQRYGNNNNSSCTSSLNNKPSHLLPTFIKIEDNHSSNSLTSNANTSDLLTPVTSSALTLHSNPPLFPYPILTPTPSMFDHHHHHIPVSGVGDMMNNPQSTNDMNIYYPIPIHSDLNSMQNAGNQMTNLAILDASSTATNLIINHDSVNLARSGGLLTPPSPINHLKPIPAGMISGCNENAFSNNNGHELEQQVNKSTPEVQDAIMQTDTPVMSEDDNTQDTVTSSVNNRGNENQSSDESSKKDVVLEGNQSHKHLSNSSSQCHFSKLGSAYESPQIVDLKTESIPRSPVPEEIIPEPIQNSQSTKTPIEMMESKEDPIRKQRIPPQKTPPPVVDLSGLELLSNSIEAFEKKTFVKTEGAIIGGANKSEEKIFRTSELAPPPGLPLQQQMVEEAMEDQKQQQPIQSEQQQRVVIEEPFDGLNLLCALAEQRLEEVVDQQKMNKTPPLLETEVAEDKGRGDRVKHRKHSSKNHHRSKSGRDSDKKFNLKRSYLGAAASIGEKLVEQESGVIGELGFILG